MIKYIGKRILHALFTMIIVISVVFILLRQMPIEGYFTNYETMSPRQVEIGLENLGLLDPLPVQLANFFKNIAKGDFGKSSKYRPNVPVVQIIKEKIGISFRFGLAAVTLALVVGLPMGIFMVRFKGRFIDKFGTVIIVLIQAIPSAIYHIVIQFFGSKALGVSMIYKENILSSIILPIFSLSLGYMAYYSMWIRRFMMDEYNKDYVKLATAKGMPDGQVVSIHVFRNAIVPLLNNIPTSLLMTMVGSIYVESLYSVPGMGGLLVDVIKRQDNNMVQMLVLFYSVLSITALLIGDILMSLADPRIRLTQKKEGESNA